MRKKQDIMWEQSTLWESVEEWVTKYLKKNHSEYRELQVKAMRIVDENPALRILINSMEGIVLTPEDHKAFLYRDSREDFNDSVIRHRFFCGCRSFSEGDHLFQPAVSNYPCDPV